MPGHPLYHLLIFRFRMFFREPAAVFWTYGFPLILAVSLGIAFRARPPQQTAVDVVEGAAAQAVSEALLAGEGTERFVVSVQSQEAMDERLRVGDADIVVVPREDGNAYELVYDPMRPESRAARLEVDAALQRQAGRVDPLQVTDRHLTEPGSRYIDFLLPGLLGMNLMGSGLWGVGFVAVDMRVRKLLKRFSATPMNRGHFLWSMIGARMFFTLPEMAVLLGAGMLLFDVPVRGNWAAILVVVILGGLSFAGIGLLVASRASKIETVSGLMNLVMLPMWLLSGIFFSTERFPDVIQPLVQILPLTQLNNALRAVILEGAPLLSQWIPLAFLAGITAITFALALRWFKWA